MASSDLYERAEQYAALRGLTLNRALGHGVQGIVLEALLQDGSPVAVKVLERQDAYERERDVYLRLRDLDLTKIHGSNIPWLIDYDDELQALCMTVVIRPYVLDFGGAYLEEPPQFSDEVIAEWYAEKKEQFGKRWPDTLRILRALAELGIHVIDVNPNNISWRD